MTTHLPKLIEVLTKKGGFYCVDNYIAIALIKNRISLH